MTSRGASVHPLRVNLLRGESPSRTPAEVAARRQSALERLAEPDPRLFNALVREAFLVAELRDVIVQCTHAEQAGADGMRLVSWRSAVAVARRELSRHGEAVRQCRWEAFHARMRRLRGIPEVAACPKFQQAALFDLVTRHGQPVGVMYWPEGARAA